MWQRFRVCHSTHPPSEAILEGLSLAQARRFYQRGYLNQFQIERDPDTQGWYIAMRSLEQYRFVLVDARTRRPRLHRRLDSALASVEQVGFKITSLATHGK